MGLVRRFLLRRIPVYVDGGLNIVDVRDVAAGHLLADEKGEVGERYILGGRNFTLDRLFADLSRISGVEPPEVKAAARRSRLRGAEAAARAHLPLGLVADEVRSASLWWTYRNTKAKQGARLQAAARTRRRSRRRSPGSASSSGRTRSAAPDGPQRDCVLRAARGPAELRRRREVGRTMQARRSSLPLPDAAPTSSVPAARSRGGCAGSGSNTGPSGCPTGAPTAPRSRS